jgi:hypothetical protein
VKCTSPCINAPPTTWCCHPCASRLGWCSSACKHLPFSSKYNDSHYGQTVLFLFHQTRGHFSKKYDLCPHVQFQTVVSLFFHGGLQTMASSLLSSLSGYVDTPSGLPCAFYWGLASVWPLYHKGLVGGVLHRLLSFWKILTSPQWNSGALSMWPSGSWSPPWPRPFSPDCSVWPGRPALGRVLVVPNYLCSWVPSMLQKCLDLCLETILSCSSTDNSFDLMAWFLALTCTVNCGTLYRQVFAFPNHVQSI